MSGSQESVSEPPEPRKFRTKPKIVDAHQWFKNGDHPEDFTGVEVVISSGILITEGQVVRRFRHPTVIGDQACVDCGKPMHVHGWIDGPVQDHVVCPGDWIIKDDRGEYQPCKPDVFSETYEVVT